MARTAIRTVVAATAAAGIACAAAAVAAPPLGKGGHGALKSALYPTTGSSPLSQCTAASGGAATGFAVLNAPGKPGGALTSISGTVSLKKAEKNAAFEVDLAVDGTCQNTGATLTTNGVGNGTAHFDLALPADNDATSYYVVLKQPLIAQLSQLPILAEAYASRAVALS